MFISLARPIVFAARRARNLFLNMIDTPVVVLLYHRVADLYLDPQGLAVSPENFRAQMCYLKDRFPLVRFEEDWSHVKSLSIVVTFDDGYADNVLNALPILEEVGVPATFFVSTGNIDTLQEYWWDELGWIILGDLPLPKTFSLSDSRFGRRWSTDSIAARKQFYIQLLSLMNKVEAERRQAWLKQFRQWAGEGEPVRAVHRSMTHEELQHLASSKWVTIGAHTVSHTRLTALSEKQQREEIFSSKRSLESLLGRTIKTFSYPFGEKNDYNRTSVSLCREAGFSKAASNFSGHAYRWTDSLQIPRYLIRNWDEDSFAAKMRLFGVR
jgi:peptidoglycan/xylan/chitin deacetylase (PgdA/CDA1 family)